MISLGEYDPGPFRAMKDIHKGERAFVVANGPSRDMVDLSKLENEVTYGTNSIIFHDFTPRYHIFHDIPFIAGHSEVINDLEGTKFVNFYVSDLIMGPGVVYFLPERRLSLPPVFRFPEDPSQLILQANSTTYTMIQVAWFLGSREIVLLGVDENITPKDGSNLFARWFAYVGCNRHAEAHGGKILNASPISELDVFERVNFDDIF